MEVPAPGKAHGDGPDESGGEVFTKGCDRNLDGWAGIDKLKNAGGGIAQRRGHASLMATLVAGPRDAGLS